MGVQDRDWFREELQRRRLEQLEDEKEQHKASKKAAQAQEPKPLRQDWHWSLKAVASLCMVVLLLILIKSVA